MNNTQTSLITKETIHLNLDAKSKFDAIHSLCGHLFIMNKTENPSLLCQDIIKREETVSTFAGSQTAIPHAITKHISEPVLCFARVSNEDFTWNNNDEGVRFILLLATPAQDDSKEIRQRVSYVFSSIAQLINQVGTLKLWETATDEQVILDSLNSSFKASQNSHRN